MALSQNVEARLARLEAESQIRRIIARYTFDIDDRNIAAVRELFTPDAVVRSHDGVMMAKGVDALIDQYHGRFKVLGAGMHVMHDVDITFDSETTARGRVSGHAEVFRAGQHMLTGLRYYDRYELWDGSWRFAEREINHLYYVSAEEYAGILGVTDRNRAYATPSPADFPEARDSWKAYEAAHPR